jgi:hypothetical protein
LNPTRLLPLLALALLPPLARADDAARCGDDLWLDPRAGTPVGARPLPTRLVCAHPLRARWNGAGSPDDAANFTCEQDSTDP